MSLDPIAIEIDWIDPIQACRAVADRSRPILLDGGAASDPSRARYSYVAADPVHWLDVTGAVVARDGRPQDGGDPFDSLRALMAMRPRRSLPGLPPFQGGAVGYLGYELGNWLERLPSPRRRGIALPDMAFGIYPTLAAFDHCERRAWVIAEDGTAAAELAAVLARPLGDPVPAGPLIEGGWRAELSPAAYRAAVARIVDYIRAGDIYQANMTQRFLARLRAGTTGFDAYRALRCRTAGPFSAFLDLGNGRAIASGSPERFLSLSDDGRVETRPIKGTRPRGATPERDAALAAELLASEKDRAENLMIVDLLRNDLSRVAVTGTVAVPTLWGLESYRTVHHLTSVVTARLQPGLDATDLLRAAFPGGSITGAPKIRAMEVIRELEPSRRGPYCGSIAWIGFDGAMDSSIIIRTLCIADGFVQAQAGGGVVADSDPEAEYQESLLKAQALLTALDPGMAWPPGLADGLELAAE